MLRPELSRLEKRAARFNRELIAIVDKSGAAGKYIVVGSVSREFESLSAAELEALKAERGDALLVVSVEKPDNR